MISSVEEYLAELKKELAGSDRATIQDALADAEEYLRTALSSAPAGDAPADVLRTAISRYGSPAEVAAAYRQVESRIAPPLGARVQAEVPAQPAPLAARDTRAWPVRFFGVFAEPRAWGSFIYLLLAMVTGIIYFTWVVTGVSVTGSLLVLIVGLPLAGLFLLSVKGIALAEGRLVEALLGVRMPRRARFAGKTGIWQGFKNLVTDPHTWFSMVYMLLMMPLGILYFTVFVTLVGVALGMAVWPIVSISTGLPVLITSAHEYYAAGLLIPVGIIAGGLLLTATMHLAKAVGRAHGALAKAMLVRL